MAAKSLTTPQPGETFAEACVREINNNLHDVKRSFIRIGCLLKEANENKYYEALGYQSIIEFAQDEFGIEKTATYGLMQVYELAHDPCDPMNIAEKFDGYTHSKLLILSRAKYTGSSSFWETVRPSDSVRDLKRFVQNWNEEYKTGCGWHLGFKTVADYLEYYDKRDAAARKALEYPGQLPGQVAMDLPEEADDQEEPEEQEFSARAEKSDPAPAVMTPAEIIAHCLKLGTVHGRESKFRLVEAYTLNSQNRFLESVQNEYGNGWFNPGSVYLKSIESDCKRLTITPAIGGKVSLSWLSVAGNISRLIGADEYLTEEEKEQYSRWKAEQSGAVIEPAQAEPAEPEFSARAENLTPVKEDPQRPQTHREYLAALPDNEFATELLLVIARVYPLGKDSATFFSKMRKHLTDWLAAPHGVNNGR